MAFHWWRFLFDLQGASPEDPAVDPGSILTILQRTGDPSSNEVTFFDISNLFYGDRIYPNSLIVQDLEVTGSGGSMTFTLKDDGLGNLYRDDLSPSGTPAKWASVGNVLYDEGLIVIKTPHLPFFGKDNFKYDFEQMKDAELKESMKKIWNGDFQKIDLTTVGQIIGVSVSDLLTNTTTTFDDWE